MKKADYKAIRMIAKADSSLSGFDYPANIYLMAQVHLNMIACIVCTILWPCSGFSRSWVS